MSLDVVIVDHSAEYRNKLVELIEIYRKRHSIDMTYHQYSDPRQAVQPKTDTMYFVSISSHYPTSSIIAFIENIRSNDGLKYDEDGIVNAIVIGDPLTEHPELQDYLHQNKIPYRRKLRPGTADDLDRLLRYLNNRKDAAAHAPS